MEYVKKRKAGAIILEGENTYLVYRKRFNDYSFPKGSCEKGETLEQTALREVLEETGIQGNIQGYIGQISYSFVQESIHYECEVHYFLMGIQSKSGNFYDDIDAVSLVNIFDLEKILTYQEDKEILHMAQVQYSEYFSSVL